MSSTCSSRICPSICMTLCHLGEDRNSPISCWRQLCSTIEQTPDHYDLDFCSSCDLRQVPWQHHRFHSCEHEDFGHSTSGRCIPVLSWSGSLCSFCLEDRREFRHSSTMLKFLQRIWLLSMFSQSEQQYKFRTGWLMVEQHHLPGSKSFLTRMILNTLT